MPSPLKYMSFSAWKNVSVGHAPNGVGARVPVGALIALRTFSCATMNALFAPASTELAGEVAGDQLRPAPAAIFRLPPVWSACAWVLTMKRIGLSPATLLDRRQELIGVFLAHRVDDENSLRVRREAARCRRRSRGGRPARAPAEFRSTASGR